MRESVTIVLNEREQAKEQLASRLLELCEESQITASRMPIDQHIVEKLKERNPHILVIDYLLGDYTTGLDVMKSFEARSGTKKPRFIFLTDEPSVTVAVETMKGGARDYIQIGSRQSLERTLETIQQILDESDDESCLEADPTPGIEDLVFESEASQELKQKLIVEASNPERCTVLYGPPGSGLTTLALALNCETGDPNGASVFDLRYCVDPLHSILKSFTDAEPDQAFTLIFDHVEEDDGELLSALQPYLLATSPRYFEVILCVTNTSLVPPWSELPSSHHVVVPPLAERTGDMPGLVQRLIDDLKDASKKKLEPLNADELKELQALEWPGNLSQFRSVVREALLRASLFQEDALSVALSAHARWNDEHLRRREVDRGTALRTLAESEQHVRVAALRLGMSTRDFVALIHGDHQV